MGGPNVQRLNNAAQPSLTGQGMGVLGGLTRGIGTGSGGASPMQQMSPGGGNPMNQASPLAGTPGSMGGATAFGNLQGMFGSPLSPGIQNTLTQMATGPNPGQGVVNAYAPIFQRNLNTAMDTGPRFSSGNDQLRTQAMNDYNMFAQQALLGGQQQQMQAAMGLGGLQNQAQLPLMQQMLQTLFTGGGLNSGPIYNVSPGFGQQAMGLLGTLGGAALGAGMGMPGFNPMSMFGGGGGGMMAPAQNVMQGTQQGMFNNPFGGSLYGPPQGMQGLMPNMIPQFGQQ